MFMASVSPFCQSHYRHCPSKLARVNSVLKKAGDALWDRVPRGRPAAFTWSSDLLSYQNHHLLVIAGGATEHADQYLSARGNAKVEIVKPGGEVDT